jgi:NAD(P)-dependent dehydrogenase (short-subunit alcohol dehydrogenase family)
MQKLEGAVAVITGAASGIGRSLALRLARERCQLALADIDAGGLAETAAGARKAGTRVTTHRVDVAALDQMTAFRDAVLREHGQVDLIVNNAGVALLGNVAEVSLEDMAWLVGINFWGVVHGAKLFLPALKQRPEAHIVNLSSVFGLIAPPGNAAYCASKFAVRGFSEALAHELAGSNIRVSTVHPGGIRTPIVTRAKAAAALGDAYRSEIITAFEQQARTNPEDAAERILRGIRRNEKRILIGGDARFLDRLQRLLPVRYWSVLARIRQRDLPRPR